MFLELHKRVFLVTKLFEGITLPGAKPNKQIDNRHLIRKDVPDTHLNYSDTKRLRTKLFETGIKFKIKVLLKAIQTVFNIALTALRVTRNSLS